MRLRKQYLTKNDCYRAGRTIRPQGVMIHSTGSNNPFVARYVPGNDVIGWNQYGNDWDRPGLEKCAHAFVGKFADGGVGTVQTLPWNRRGWHCGRGKNGSANDTHISFEICEDGLTDASYFNAVYKEAVELCVYLCKLYNLTEKDVIGHYEGYQKGIASNHGDPKNWFPKHGKSMDIFRADVKKLLSEGEKPAEQEKKKYYRVQIGAYSVKANAEAQLAKAKKAGFTDSFIKYD